MVNRRTFLLGAAGTMLLSGCGGNAAKSPPTSTTRPPVRTGHLRVPGARLYYETRGSGPPLLMIHGGVVDSGSFAAIAPELAGHFTVITYDRRGNSRSELDGPATELRLEQQADDAGRLLEKLIDEPPHVFGSSGGAIVALELAARYQDKLGTVVSHEPPVPGVLSDAAAQQAVYEDIHKIYRRAGAEKAFQQFMTLDPGEPDPVAGRAYPADPEFDGRIAGNVEFMVANEMLPFIRYRPNLAALRAKLPALVLGVGHYRAEVASRIVETLAGQLSTTATEFPGDHTGYMWHPREFAEKLRAILG